MTSQIEREHSSLPEVNGKQNSPDNNSLPHGVAPETYGLLLFARDHKEILDVVDSLDEGKRIINPTRNLIGVYFGTEASIRDLAKAVGGDRVTTKRRILDGLEAIWQYLPPELQSQYPKEKTVRLKESTSISSWEARKRSKAAITLWQNDSYTANVASSLRERANNPHFIRKMKEISQGKLSPMEDKRHLKQSVTKIKNTTQENWNKQHGIDLNDPLAKRNALIAEWQRLSQLLTHPPSSTEITRLKQKGETKFSTTMYKQEFGQGSFTRAKETLATITKTKEQLITKRYNFFVHRFGKDERSMWQYTVEHNLQHTMIQAGIITKEELELIRQYYEDKIIGENLTKEIFNKFTIAVAKVA